MTKRFAFGTLELSFGKLTDASLGAAFEDPTGYQLTFLTMGGLGLRKAVFFYGFPMSIEALYAT